MPVSPRAHDVVPVLQPLRIEAGQVEGIAIAVQFTGAEVSYLVVNEIERSRPVWVTEGDVSAGYMAERR